MSQPTENQSRKVKRRNSILKPVQNEVDVDDDKKDRRRVSFHNTKMVQKYEREERGLHGNPVKLKINETAGSDGVLSPGRMSHISGSSGDPNGTRTHLLSETYNDSASMLIVRKTTILEIESLENTAAHMIADAGQLNPPWFNVAETVVAACRASNNGSCYADESMDVSRLNSTVLNNTADMFAAPSGAAKKEACWSGLKSPIIPPVLNATCDMFCSPNGMDKSERTLFGGDMSTTMLNVPQEDTMLMFPEGEPSLPNEMQLMEETNYMFPQGPAPSSYPHDSSKMEMKGEKTKSCLHKLQSQKCAPFLDSTCDMFGSPKGFDKPDMTLIGGDMSTTMLNVSPDATMRIPEREPSPSNEKQLMEQTNYMFPPLRQETTTSSLPHDKSEIDMKVDAMDITDIEAVPQASYAETDNIVNSAAPRSNFSSAEILTSDENINSRSAHDLTTDRTYDARHNTIVLSSDTCRSPVKEANDTLCLGSDIISQVLAASTTEMNPENERRDVSFASNIPLLNNSGLGDLKTIGGKDSSNPTDSLNVSAMSNRGKQRRRSQLVAHLDTSIRSEPRDVTRKNFDLNTSNNGGDTNSHSAETLMRIQRLLQFDPRSVKVAVVEPVSNQNFANVRRKMLTEDLHSNISSSLNMNEEVVRGEIAKVTKTSRKLALEKLKFSDLDVVDRDVALGCRRLAEASWWESRNKVVRSHLETAICSNSELEQHLEKLDHDLYLVENSSTILKDTSRLKDEVEDADYLFNIVNPEEVDEMLAAELKLLNKIPSLELPQLHCDILKDCGNTWEEYEVASLGERDVVFLKKLKILQALITETNKNDADIMKLEKSYRDWELYVERRQEKRGQKKRHLNSVLVQFNETLAALDADYSDVFS